MWEWEIGYALNCKTERVVRSWLVRGREVGRRGGRTCTAIAIRVAVTGGGGALAFTLSLLGGGHGLARLTAVLSKRLELGGLIILDERDGTLGTLAVEAFLDCDCAGATAGRDEEALGEVVLQVALARRRDTLHARDAALATVNVLL